MNILVCIIIQIDFLKLVADFKRYSSYLQRYLDILTQKSVVYTIF